MIITDSFIHYSLPTRGRSDQTDGIKGDEMKGDLTLIERFIEKSQGMFEVIHSLFGYF